jgi:4-amino-4-deoxy-L-arabinose transferase-like glycosyltransferase
LQLSYYDHPPMVAYLIRASTELFGDGILAVRLPAVLASFVVVLVIGGLSRPRSLVPVVVLSPMMTFHAVLITPDTPLLLFWALYLAWLTAMHQRLSLSEEANSSWNEIVLWALGGAILGCGVLGKYTTGLAAIAGTASFVVSGFRSRRWVPGFMFHALIAFVVASPILIHNLRHDFVPLRYQWGHSMSSPAPGLGVFAEFVGVQLLLVGAVPFAVFVWCLRNRWELRADPRLRPIVCLFLIPFAFFLLKATRGRLEGNWAFPCYIACWPLAAVWHEQVRGTASGRWAVRAAFSLPASASAVLLLHLVEPLPIFPASSDRATRQWVKLEIARQAATDLRARGYTGPVYVMNYQWTALLRREGLDARQLPGMTRPSHFTERSTPPIDPAGVVLFCDSPPQFSRLPPEFANPRSEILYPLRVRGREFTVCRLIDCSESGGGFSLAHHGNFAGRLDPGTGDSRR